MIAFDLQLFPFRSYEVWWPARPEDVTAFFARAPLVSVRGCSNDLASLLEGYSFRRKSALTLLVDLTRPTEELWGGFKKKSCRVDIRKAEKRNPEIGVNREAEAAFRLINEHIERKRYRPPLRRGEWQRLLSHGDVFTIGEGGNLISAHGVMVDPAGRVRLTMSGEVDPGEGRYRGIVGPMNRLLHWHEMQYYKERGIRHYDFGGLVVDEASPAYEISRFKLSFGGEPAVENVLRLWRGAASRRLLRSLAGPDGTRRVLNTLIRAGDRLRATPGGHRQDASTPAD